MQLTVETKMSTAMEVRKASTSEQKILLIASWSRGSNAVSGVLSDLGFQHLALVRPEIGLEAVFAINCKRLLFVASTTTKVYPKRKTA